MLGVTEEVGTPSRNRSHARVNKETTSKRSKTDGKIERAARESNEAGKCRSQMPVVLTGRRRRRRGQVYYMPR